MVRLRPRACDHTMDNTITSSVTAGLLLMWECLRIIGSVSLPVNLLASQYHQKYDKMRKDAVSIPPMEIAWMFVCLFVFILANFVALKKPKKKKEEEDQAKHDILFYWIWLIFPQMIFRRYIFLLQEWQKPPGHRTVQPAGLLAHSTTEALKMFPWVAWESAGGRLGGGGRRRRNILGTTGKDSI